MKKTLALAMALATPLTAFGGGVAREISKAGKAIDPTNKNSEVRKAGRNVDPTNKNSKVRKAGRNIDPTNPDSNLRRWGRSIDPMNSYGPGYIGPGRNRKHGPWLDTLNIDTALSWVNHHLDKSAVQDMLDAIDEQDDPWRCGFYSGTRSLKAAKHTWDDLEFRKNNYYYSMKVGGFKVGATPNQLERYLEKCGGAACSWKSFSGFDNTKDWIQSEIDSGYSPVALLFNDYILKQHYISVIGYDSKNVLTLDTNKVFRRYRWADFQYDMKVYGIMYQTTSLNRYNIVTVH